MARPVIVIVDDEPPVLNAVERDLRGHFRASYRIMKAGSGREALDLVHGLKRRDQAVALLLADQRMPGMSGTEFLAEARALYPDARKVLLTAYADTQAAIDSINEIGLDHYLMKPWDPPEERLFPTLDDLLSDWRAGADLPYEGIRVAGTLWSASCHRAKDFLSRNRIPYRWLDIDQDDEARTLVDGVDREPGRLPVVFFADGTVLVDPEPHDLAVQAGLKTQATERLYDFVIVGGGPAGLGAAVYGASEGLRTALIEREATGGQAGTSSRIENYLGFPQGISGADLARRATDQANRLGAEILTAVEATGVRVEDPYRIVELSDGTELSCKALLIATGVSVKTLDVPGIDAVAGAGVYYGAALTEAANFAGRPVFVVGGANSAGQGAMWFSRYASRVTMLVRGISLEAGMSQYLVDQINATENIDVMVRTEVVSVGGEGHLESITIRNRDDDTTATVPAAAMFVFIGAAPRTGFLEGVVERNAAGYVPTGPDLIKGGRRPRNWTLRRDPYQLETSVPGIFAAGDVRQGSMHRVVSAVGSGGVAVGLVHQYLRTV